MESRLQPTATGTLLIVSESGFAQVPAGRRAAAFRMDDNGWTHQLVNIERHVAQQR